MTNRIDTLFLTKKSNILSIYFTAGYPNLTDTVPIIEALQANGVDLIEIGMPFSDPLADGPVIQDSSTQALQNGMSIPILFEQLKNIRKNVSIPLILMGYINPIMQFGIEKFAKKASELGIDGIIVPDLPIKEYLNEFRAFFDAHNLRNIFLITPQTTEDRVRYIDDNSKGFIYMVSSSSTTGTKDGTSDGQISYFERIESYNLENPRLIGFGIKDKQSFEKACKYGNGAIIGTAFVQQMSKNEPVESKVKSFIQALF
ncbi:MAG: tryptophan synthase subunit alpha [Bacteroidota bacterium]|nr:tryptophan synthase subunit alpha [Bacteroidota bacterium]